MTCHCTMSAPDPQCSAGQALYDHMKAAEDLALYMKDLDAPEEYQQEASQAVAPAVSAYKKHIEQNDVLAVVRCSVRPTLTFPNRLVETLFLYGMRRPFAVWGEEWNGESEGVYIQDPRFPAYPAYLVLASAVSPATRARYALVLLFAPTRVKIRRQQLRAHHRQFRLLQSGLRLRRDRHRTWRLRHHHNH